MKIRILAIGLLSVPALAFAGGTASLQAVDDAGGQVVATVEYSAGNLRVTSPNLKYGYLLARGDQIYNVASINGQPVVLQAADIMRMAGTRMPSPTAAIEQVKAVVSLEATTRHETVAGIDGTVYTLTYEDGQGTRRAENLVLAKDANASEFTGATVKLGRTLAKMSGTIIPPGADDLVARIQRNGQGLLRFGNRFKVTALNGTEPSPSRFDLPSGSLQVPDLGNIFPGMNR
jgi:hypothetical protein